MKQIQQFEQQEVAVQLNNTYLNSRNRYNANEHQHGTVLTIARPTPAVAMNTSVESMLCKAIDKSPVASVVVLDCSRPIGLVMRYDLDRRLGSQFGRDLYLRREVTTVMNPSPLVAEGGSSIESVAQQAMQRNAANLFDDIIVTNSGSYAGTVSVQTLMIYLARVESVLATAGAVCHEMNQPLQILLSGIELLVLTEVADERKDLLRTAQSQIIRMHSTTKRLHSITSYTTKPYINDTLILDIGNNDPE